MPRLSSEDALQRSAGQPSSLPQEMVLELESKLSLVIEQAGVTISSSSLEESKMSNRAKRGIRRRNVSERPKLFVKTQLVSETSVPVLHPTHLFDKELVAQLRRAATLPPTLAKGSAAAVPVRFTSHVSSDHVVSLQLPARPIVEQLRDPFGRTVQSWMAPYQIPPSVEGIAAAMQDLWLEEVDPRVFIEQFTPAQAYVHYGERSHWLSKIVKPFIIWEVRIERDLEDDVMEQVKKDEAPLRGAQSFQVPFLSEPAQQFTPVNIEAAYTASYGVWGTLKRTGRRILSIFDRTEKHVQKDVVKTIEQEEQVAHDPIEHESTEGAKQEWHIPTLVPRVHVVRLMAGFLLLLCVVTLPAGAVSLSRSLGGSVQEVRSQSRVALSEVSKALSEPVHNQAESWALASNRFAKAREALMRTNALALGLAQTLPQTRREYDSAQRLLLAGERTSQAARLLVQGLSRALTDQAGVRPDERIAIFLTYLNYASPLLEEALTAVEKTDPYALPTELRPQITKLYAMVSDGRTSIADTRELLIFMRDILGRETPRTYLFVFQNPAEVRPTGGFMGSVAEVVFDRGVIQSVHVPGGGPYDLRSQLKTRVAAPRPLQLVGGQWEFQDANWFPDFPAAAEKIRWFWSQAGQPTLDGVISINASLLEKLLRITGPIDMPEYGKTLTADNIMVELQKSVELEYDKQENKPKKIIGDLFPKLLEHLKAGSQEDWLKLVDIGLQALDTKEVQIWMTRAEEEQIVEKYDWSGRLKPATGDALAIIEANIGGKKSDAFIEENVDHHVQVAEDGTIIDTVTLTRTHQALAGELFYGANNVSYVRVYVPPGSELLEAQGFEPPDISLFETPLPEDKQDADEERLVSKSQTPIAGIDVTQEFGRTAFGGWIQLRPGQTRVTSFRYKLPFTVFELAKRVGEDKAAYMLLLTSQSGKTQRNIHSRLSLPSDWHMQWIHNPTPSTAQEWTFEATWDRDYVLAGLIDAK